MGVCYSSADNLSVEPEPCHENAGSAACHPETVKVLSGFVAALS